EAVRRIFVAAKRADDSSAIDPHLNSHPESRDTIEAPPSRKGLLARSGVEQTLQNPESQASKPASTAIRRWLKFGSLGAIPTVLLAYVLVKNSGRAPSFPEPPSQISAESHVMLDRQFLIGTWRSHQMEKGQNVLIYWTLKADGTTSYDYSVDGQKVQI